MTILFNEETSSPLGAFHEDRKHIIITYTCSVTSSNLLETEWGTCREKSPQDMSKIAFKIYREISH